MATYDTYKCEKCGWSIDASPFNPYLLRSGEYDNIVCRKYHKISNIDHREYKERMAILHEIAYKGQLKCPICGQEPLQLWQPEGGRCPKCGGKLHRMGGFILAD